ncbi:hypothetical protein PLICRDRAFT_594915 [Plicaturopsis crispa FD-325 SS-3]|nr:hypothetical protein PLICRDRAFT_594915 [Plicaturopsis crispa FD-325 SS-3]
MASLARKSNVGLDLFNKVAVVVGGTQGIGAAVGMRFASAGASVYIIGRNGDLGSAVVEQLKTAGKSGATYEFIKADLSLVSGIKDTVQQLQAKTGAHGIDYLVQTQGGPPNGKFSLTAEGHEPQFVVQSLSRFGISYLLAKSGTLKESVVNIYAPVLGSSRGLDLDDLELKKAKEEGKYGILPAAHRDGDVLNSITYQFAIDFPHLKVYHVHPGLVATDAFKNQNFPYLVVFLYNILSPIISRTIGTTASTYADIPVYLAANLKSRGLGLEFSNHNLKPVAISEWIRKEPESNKRLWEKLVEMLNEAM